jgi:hypothetical protein
MRQQAQKRMVSCPECVLDLVCFDIVLGEEDGVDVLSEILLFASAVGWSLCLLVSVRLIQQSVDQARCIRLCDQILDFEKITAL